MEDVSFTVAGWNSKEALLMQKRLRVGAGPSLKTWPKWAPQFVHVTSVRIIPGFLINNNRFAPTKAFKTCTNFFFIFFFFIFHLPSKVNAKKYITCTAERFYEGIGHQGYRFHRRKNKTKKEQIRMPINHEIIGTKSNEKWLQKKN